MRRGLEVCNTVYYPLFYIQVALWKADEQEGPNGDKIFQGQ